MKLFAKITDPNLLWKSMHELGFTFYRITKMISGTSKVEVLYFAGSRCIYFEGEMNQEEVQRLKALAFPAKKIDFDEYLGVVKIEQ